MAQTSPTSHLQDPAILEEACSRNRPIELHYHSTSGEFFAAKSRLLGIDGDQLQLDRPQSIGKQIRFWPDQVVEAFIASGTHIYTFRSRVIKTQCHFGLNDYVTVDGLCIAKPAVVAEGQRRHSMRVSLANLDRVDVTLHQTCPDHPDAAPLDATVFKGRLANLSVGGCGLVLDTTLASKFSIGKPVFLTFKLPGQEPPFLFQVEVRSVSLTQPHHDATRLGVQFLNWPSQASLRRAIRPLERFIADIQRQARRSRGPRR